MGEMAASVVHDALARAAQRAQRLAELDMAHTTMERLLNFPHPPETLPWVDAMSKSYFLETNIGMIRICQNAVVMQEIARMNEYFPCKFDCFICW